MKVQNMKKTLLSWLTFSLLTVFVQAQPVNRHFPAIDSARALLAALPRGAVATCTWGEQGAWALDFRGDLWHAPAHPPPTLVDTLGAGDVFNAGMLAALSAGMPVAEALRRANRLAAEQCGREGLELSNA